MRVSRAWIACLLLLPVAACSDGDAPRPEADRTHPGLPQRSGPPAGMDESLRDAALELVQDRERALVDGDRDAFLATIDPSAEEFVRTQARWWDNIAELPATDLSLTLGDEGVMTRVHGEGGLQLPIDFTMRLEGYDQHAVTQPLVYTFVGDEDEVRLTSDRNLQIDALTGWLPAPWDVTAITVEESDGVLGVFDDRTKGDAAELQDDIVAAREAIEPFVPPWSGKVVAYDISDVDAIDTMSSMSVDETGGVAFPVMKRPGSTKVAAHRFSVNPASTQTSLQRGFLFRHELVHVALGELDDSSPTWLTEGSAEYVARAVALSEQQRRVVAAANLAGLDPARLARRARYFYTRSPAENYEMAALVCDYLASTRGPDVLWDLMRVVDEDEELVNMADVEAALRVELGMSKYQLYTAALDWARAA